MAWSNPLSGFIRQVEQDVSNRQKEMTLYALQQLIMRSPVDSGAYRGSHFVTVGAADSESVPNQAPGEAERQAEMMLAADSQPFKRVFVQTNIAYGEVIENGHSQQAPQGVYETAFNSLTEKYSR